MEKYILLILGAIIGFIASIMKDYFAEKTKNKYKDLEFKKEKLEELFILVSRTFNETLKPLDLRNNLDKDSGAKTAMIIRFYFPHLFKDYQDFLQNYSIINQKIVENYKSIQPEDFNHFTKEYQKFLKVLETESKKYY